MFMLMFSLMCLISTIDIFSLVLISIKTKIYPRILFPFEQLWEGVDYVTKNITQ